MKKILLIFLIICFSCYKPDINKSVDYVCVYGTCPEYPEVKHWRKVGKNYNPENCNWIKWNQRFK